MSRRGPVTTPSLVVSVLVLALVVAAPPVTAVTTATATAGPDAGESRCFPPDGTEFVIGTEGPQIRLVVHLSLLSAVADGEGTNATSETVTDAGNATAPPGALGIEATATTGEARVVALRSGVVFEGVADATRFVTDPLEPFAFAFDYRFTIPAFEGTAADADYRAADAPVEGPVEEAACST
jgi:hypothetical protein